MKTDLANVIQCLGQQALKYAVLQDGKTAVLVLPEYGRVLGCWPDIEKDNQFWLNENFLNGQRESNWINPGGHRIWLAPEREFFISDLKRPFETYKVPKEIDPGNYTMLSDASSVKMNTSGKLQAFASDTYCEFNITRTIKLLSQSDIRKFINNTQVDAAGYLDSIECRTDKNCPAGIWSLMQVPLHGTISMPVSRPDAHKILFGDAGNLVRYENGLMNLSLVPAPRQEFKIGFKASNCSNVITYSHTCPDGSAVLVVKKFELSPESIYLDTPWSEPDDKGYAVQFFCGGIHGFGELETHAPVYINNEKAWESKLITFVYAFSGRKELIDQIQAGILSY